MAVLQSGGQPEYHGGDPRIPHFVGIHGTQFILLAAAAAMALGARGLSVNRQRALVWVGAAFYFGLTMLVTGQPLRNESIVAPSAQTLGVAVGLAARQWRRCF